MRIMYLLFSFTIGGTECLVTDICNEMSIRGNEVHLYIVNDLISEELIETLNKDVKVFFQKRPIGKGKKLATLWMIARYVKRNRIQTIHCNSLNSPELLLFSSILNHKTKIIYTVHGIGQYKTLGKTRVTIRNKMCDSIIGISDAVVNDIIDAGADKNKVIRIYNGVNPQKYSIAKKKDYDSNKIVIGSIGRIMPSIKGQDVLLYAVPLLKKSYPEIKVMFAGGVADDQKQEYKKLLNYVDKMDLSDNVDFIGTINNVPELLNHIDICVVPSKYEGFGLVLIEAMAMGVPCVVSDVGGLKEIVNNEKIGMIFPSGDYEALARCIKTVVDNYAKYKEQSWERKEEILLKYSIQKLCDNLQNIY